MTSDPEPSVRVLEPRSTRPANAGMVTLMVGVAGLLLGYVLGAAGTGGAGGDPELADSGRTVGGPVDDDGTGATTTTTTTSTAATTTSTTSTTRPPAGPDPVLYELVPPLAGRRIVGTGEGGAFVWTSGDRQPRIIDLPTNSWSMWHESGRLLAYVKSERSTDGFSGNQLWLSHDGRPAQPIWIGVTSFAWHPTERRIGWIGTQIPDTTWHAYSATVNAYGLEDVAVVDLGIEIDHESAWTHLTAFGDYGWVIQHDRWEGETTINALMTVGPDGTIVGEREGFSPFTVSPDGQILAHEITGTRATVRWLDFTLTDTTDHEFGANSDFYGADWAPDIGRVLLSGVGGPSLYPIDGSEAPQHVPIPVTGYSAATSSDGELILSVTGESSRATDFVIYEMATGEWWSLRVPGLWWQLDIG